MTIWSRDFTRFEKILLLILSILLLGLVYYQFVDKPVRRSIASARAENEAIEAELAVVAERARYLEGLQKEMDGIRAEGAVSRMESYNNSKSEIAFLNEVLADTIQYNIAFSDVTRQNDQIRRAFTLQFRAGDYYAMRKIIEKICKSEDRCLVSDIRCSVTSNERESYVTANVTATFYETMVGGTPDAGLPADTAQEEE